MNDKNKTAGLSSGQVKQRKRKKTVNSTTSLKTKTIKQIVKENLITPFNMINAVLAGLILLVGSYKNLVFMGLIFINILIGIVQEIRAKRAVDKLAELSNPKAEVVRNGEKHRLSVNELVIGDILLLAAGNQVYADCVILDGECEISEALISGKSEIMEKKAGDHLQSGCFLGSGSCRAEIEHIGSENYVEQITHEALSIEKTNSDIMVWINKVIKWIGFSIVPVGLLLFFNQFYISRQSADSAVLSAVAAVIAMIPEGLVLLTSIVLAVSVVRLARHRALIQELYSVETLARVDTLCLDKTGTITENILRLEAIVPLCQITQEQTEDAIAALVDTMNDENPTNRALRRSLRKPPDWKCTKTISFSSERKWSGASFRETGSFFLGAGEFILKNRFESIRAEAEHYSGSGHRVLLLAHSCREPVEEELPEDVHPLAFILLGDKIRSNARETLEFFSDQGVDIKVISGDNALTVSNVAEKAGLWDADNYIDVSTLSSYEEIKEAAQKYSVFGRVTPQQKHDLIKALKELKHTVAMTGDGINDVLALKESDCSIAMASGSDAARAVSQVILLDSDFSSMPRIVGEGRRSINNMQRSAALYLVKTMFSMIITVLFLFFTVEYPFQPIQYTLINTLTISVPSFMLALEPNHGIVQGKFSVNVIKRAIPGTVTMVLNIILLVTVHAFLRFSPAEYATLAVILTGFTGFLTLFRISYPFNRRRILLFFLMVLAFIISITAFRTFFSLAALTLPMAFVLVPMMITSLCLMAAGLNLIKLLSERKNQSGEAGASPD